MVHVDVFDFEGLEIVAEVEQGKVERSLIVNYQAFQRMNYHRDHYVNGLAEELSGGISHKRIHTVVLAAILRPGPR